ncbi:MAG: di-trans,poly-cis-decaprenylcistransferase [Clostridiales bacterium]|jgi:undecaprenyl diphosphate synthase|nr:di-trans,poly-cis-decaprenylcistransferase [Clostridiales bacterium]
MEVPEHIAVIMDGSGRWAKGRGLPVYAGHNKGSQALRRLVLDANRELFPRGLKIMTFYAFSTENRRRSQEEISGLMKILRFFVREYTAELLKNKISLSAVGDISWFDEDIQRDIKELEETTGGKPGSGLRVVLALNYGGRDEIRRAAVKIALKLKNGEISENDIDEKLIGNSLDTAGLPDPALIIRTSGERRLSNFLPWQSAYSELFFDDALWPDYDIERLKAAIEDFNGRGRRFGARGV